MPDLRELLLPEHTAVVTSEVQRGVVGPDSILPELAKAAEGMVDNVAALLRGARAAGASVVHCTATRRKDGKGSNRNARLFMAVRGSPLAPTVLPEIGPDDSDVVLVRYHGLSPMGNTDLDAVLRNLGVTTIVATGVSVNIAVTNLAFDAVNAGYQVVIPRDAVAGLPQEYVDAVFANTLNLVATVTTTADVLGAWQ
ncbi:MAG: cysteine hydrolase [Actinobacteria bacterium]|nr:cysteine hydrolase [Actinomycetota bacterium]MBV9663391.1 cysteine hydrolase [Actinomycetota bacterium]MBV9935048.1 cysteine hydrolase [Actinomycetota bacterium]